MKPINIFELTRILDAKNIQKFEKQMSGRNHFLPVKEWETDGLRTFVFNVLKNGGETDYEFFYSFQIPKLGKEFDLLRISDEMVVNVELKSGNVSDEKIKNQLAQNRYYLYSLGLRVRSYTYISDTERLVRLTNGGRLVDESFETLVNDLKSQKNLYTGNAEDLFKEEEFLISPLTDPDKFLRGDYFLTSQQKDIKRKIFEGIENEKLCFGFTGLPGTGKTLLLYDIAMALSIRDRVCVFHYGSYPEELRRLDERLKRIDFFHPQEKAINYEEMMLQDNYKAALVDEGHRIGRSDLDKLMKASNGLGIPLIISYDSEEAISLLERHDDVAEMLETIEDFECFSLTNRIRMNSELSTFIRLLMKRSELAKRGYPSVNIFYADNIDEAQIILKEKQKKGYVYICDSRMKLESCDSESVIDADLATCREFDRVLMVMDKQFFYDDKGYLRSGLQGESGVRLLFHGLSRAKKELALIIIGDEALFGSVMKIIQPEEKGRK